jgi:hypothetical protein
MPQRPLSAEDIALAQSFGQLAHEAAGLQYTEDRQKIFRSSRPDEIDADLFRRGEESARQIWPGH